MQIIIYNPLGASKGHSKIYASGIINGFINPADKITLITSKDFDSSLLKRKDIKITRINQITSKKIKKINFADNLKYGFFLFKNSFNSLKYLNIYRNKSSIILLIGGNTLFNSLYLIFVPNKKNYGLTLHNADYELSLYKKNYLKLIYKFLNKLFLKILINSELKLFCHGEFTRKEIAKQLNSKEARINSYLAPIENSSRKENKSKHIDNMNSFNLLFFGIIREDKGLDILLKALNLCKDIDYKLNICGNSEQIGMKSVKNLLKLSNTPERITTEFGYVDDNKMEEYFYSSTYVVLPYKKTFKALSIVFGDSIKRYKPVITTNSSQNGFDTHKYELGEIFESENIFDLHLAIKRAHLKWETKNLPKKEKFLNYLDKSSPENITKSILKSFDKR